MLALDNQFHEHIPTMLPFRPELKEAYAADDTLLDDAAKFNAALQAGILWA